MFRAPLSLALMSLLVADVQAQPASFAPSARVEALVAQMTLREKAGQMTQLTLTPLAAGPSNGSGRVRLDAAKLREAIVERGIGSIINVHDDALPVEGWHALLGEVEAAAAESRLGIPVLYGIDNVHGANYVVGGTIFPHGIGIGATFDRALAERAAEVAAAETAAAGLPWNFTPVLDVGRQPMWPRFYETFGEDPTLAAALGVAAIRGMQASGLVAATMKHYLGYGGPLSGRDRTPIEGSMRVVRERYLPPFAAAVDAGALTLMVNSGEIDGEPVHASRYWLTDVLRGELGFEGVVVTDWEDVIFLQTRHRVAATLKDAVRLAVEAGIDISMTPYDYDFADLLVELVEEGAIPESRLDDSVRRILTLKERLGLFDAPLRGPDAIGAPAHRAAARETVRASVTLLKNDGDVLPLAPDARVAVVGPAAADLTALHGGWSYTWQGTDARFFPAGSPTLLDALRARGGAVSHARGSTWTEADDLDAAVAAARAADVVVLALGETGYAEWVGDIDDITLPEAQLRLAEAVIETGTPVVLVLLEGRPRVIRRIADRVQAIVMAYWPGSEGAEALAEVLYGEVSPSGRLPFTYPAAPGDLTAYDHKTVETLDTGFTREPGGFPPQFTFGHGLSYTTFDYSDLRLSAAEIGTRDDLDVEVTVTNTGGRAGRHSVLLFTRQHVASLTPHVRRLRDFGAATLAPGASETLRFTLTPDDFAFVGLDGRLVVEPGSFSVLVGDREATFTVSGARRVLRDIPTR
jgi:beta-glucosidase